MSPHDLRPLDIVSILRRTPLFAKLHAEPLAAIAKAASVRELAGGHCLMNEGEPSDTLYILVSGRLRASSLGTDLSDIGVHEVVGEIGVAADRPRMATVHALRDSVLLEFPGLELLAALQNYPAALFIVMQNVVRHMQRIMRHLNGPTNSPIKTLGVLALGPDAAEPEFCRRLLEQLRARGQTRVLDAAAIDQALGPGSSQIPFGDTLENRRLMRWLGEQEQSSDLLVFMAGQQPGEWQRRCLRQADTLLLLANAQDPRIDPAVSRELDEVPSLANRELVLCREGAAEPQQVLRLRDELRAGVHHYWQPGEDAGVAPIARQLLRLGIGAVLGGGGARGFAHIGLVRALDELHIPIDLYGGSSMGAFISALWACGLSAREMVQTCRSTFVERNLLSDFTLPRVSLIRGRRFMAELRAIFGDQQIEHLPKPYFCMSTNLTAGSQHMHDRGDLATWVAASMCIPGVAPPVGWRGDLHADGGIVNNLPTDVLHARGRGPVLASSVSTEGVVHCRGVEGPDSEVLLNWPLEDKRPSLFEILTRTATLTSESGMERRAALADVYLQMPVPTIGMFEWEHIDDLVRLGYDHAIHALLERRALLLNPS